MSASFRPGPLPGTLIIQPTVVSDHRGYFIETYKHTEYHEHGVLEVFVQDNHCLSVAGVLRGLHFQRGPFAQGKLVRVVRGAVWDVAVDVRIESPTRGQWFGLELSAENRTQLYLPPGFAHGFLTLSREAEFCYKCSAEYHRASEGGIRWDDPDLAIAWPLADLRVSISSKDSQLPSFRDFLRSVP